MNLKMKSKEQLVTDALELAKNTVPLYEILDFVIAKGKELAEIYKGDKDIIIISICLMDLKIKDAREKGDITLHTQLAADFAKDYLKNYDISENDKQKIINCIESHHGKIPFSCIEAEICTNADCYVFIHPKGVLNYTKLMNKRNMSFEEQIQQLNFKLQEKYKLLSLNKTKEELEKYYNLLNNLYKTILEEIS